MEEERDRLRVEGNAFYQSKQHLKAAASYTKAIKLDGKDAVLYSNRSAALLQLSKVKRALADAEVCVELRPDWEKGYFRKGAALEAMGDWEGALSSYREAHSRNPGNTEVAAKVKACSRLVRTRNTHTQKEMGHANGSKKGSDEEKRRIDKGEDYAYDPARIESYTEELVTESITKFLEDGVLDETISFLPGKRGEDGGEIVGQVRIKDAFSSPDTLAKCVDFLRQYAEDVGAHAAIAVIDKSKISFPQVWRKEGPSGWKLGDHKGFFVQQETREGRKVWFIRHRSGKAVPEKKVPLNAEDYALLPPLIRSAQ